MAPPLTLSSVYVAFSLAYEGVNGILPSYPGVTFFIKGKE